MNQSGNGFLRVRVTEAAGALPVRGAVVRITEYPEEEIEQSLAEAQLPNLKKVCEEAEKLDIHPDFLSVGGASDGSLLSAMGCAVMDGCGPESDKYHSVDEFLLTDSIEQRFHLLLGAIKGLA